jgi:hypothetical protein
MDTEAEDLSTQTVFQKYVYISEADADTYFKCKAEYLNNTDYAVSVTGPMQSVVEENVKQIQASASK